MKLKTNETKNHTASENGKAKTEDNDLPSSMEFLKNRKDFFKDLRLDTALNEMLCDAQEFADKIDMTANFELPSHVIQFEERMLISTMRHEKIR
ncbi:hypothetical protein TNCV_227421 [Trichonephila clavipes]|nr:hypothetical protein TNCV_227421 [Trichonephila clavipes]